MSESCSARPDGGSTRSSAAAFRAAEGISLAAAPTFAIMALQTAVFGGGPGEMLCSAAHPPALSGMVPMYVLMSAFHSSPWLKLISGRGRAVRRPDPAAAAMADRMTSSKAETKITHHGR